MIIANIIKDLMAAVHLASDGSQVATGTIFAVIRLESDDADDEKYWDADDDSWQASPVAWPEANHTQAAQWVYPLPAAASNGKDDDSVHYTMTDDLDEAAATTVCGGGEHRINAENPLATSDLSNLDATVSSRATPANVTTNTNTVTAAITTAEGNVRGSDSDDLKDISDEIAASELAIRGADSDTLETLSDQLDTVTAPAGARQITIHVEDELAASIPGAQVSIYDSLNTTFITRSTTDPDGDYVVALDDATYQLRIIKDLFGFTTPEPIVVTADAVKTIIGTAFTAPTPSSADLCVIYGTLRDTAGVVQAGACVEAYAVVPQVNGAIQASDRIAHTATNASGYFELELTIDMEIWLKAESTGIDESRTVPDAPSQNIATWT